MATQWNKYEATVARKHGKPGRELRPKSTTIDIHSHVAIPQAAAYVKPHLDKLFPCVQLGAGQAGGSQRAIHRIKHAYQFKSLFNPRIIARLTLEMHSTPHHVQRS